MAVDFLASVRLGVVNSRMASQKNNQNASYGSLGHYLGALDAT
jgi:hypothetical protein